MVILRVHYPVSDYERWKRGFDRDSANRRQSGVLRYTVQRSIADSGHVMTDMELSTREQAESLLIKMRRVWDVNGLTSDSVPDAWILETTESVDLA